MLRQLTAKLGWVEGADLHSKVDTLLKWHCAYKEQFAEQGREQATLQENSQALK